MDFLILLFIFSAYVLLLGDCASDQTKYMTKCSDVGGPNTIFRIEENINNFVLYNISNVHNNITFEVRQTGSFVNTSLQNGYGIVTLAKSLDYENSQSYSYELICEYRYDMNIIVQNVVEDSLSFYNSSYRVSISKDVSLGAVVLDNLLVKYGDANPSDITVSVSTAYFFLSYKTVATFQLQVKKLLEVGVYKFNIIASMPNFPNKNGTAEITVNVYDDKIKVYVLENSDGGIYRTMTIVFGCLTGILSCSVLLLLHKLYCKSKRHDEVYKADKYEQNSITDKQDRVSLTDEYDLLGKKHDNVGKADDNENVGKADDNDNVGKADDNDNVGNTNYNDNVGKADDNENVGKADDNENVGKVDDNDNVGKADKADEHYLNFNEHDELKTLPEADTNGNIENIIYENKNGVLENMMLREPNGIVLEETTAL